jgi:Phosphate-selective porin O and P
LSIRSVSASIRGCHPWQIDRATAASTAVNIPVAGLPFHRRREMRRVLGGAVLVATLAFAAPLEAQEQNKDDVQFKTSALELTFNGRVQVQAGTSSCSEFPIPDDSACAEQVPASDLFLRRVRLTVSGKINDMIDFRIQPDYNKVDKLSLKDAWGRFTFSKAFRLKAGHFKRPFDGFVLVSSTETLTVEREIAIRGLETVIAPSLTGFTTLFDLSDRDVGVELSGSTGDGLFSYWVGGFTGNSDLKFQDSNSSKQFIGRGQLEFDAGPKQLKVAAAAAATDASYESVTEGMQSRYYYNYELYAEWGDFGLGPHAQLGFVIGDNPLQNQAGGIIDLEAGDEFASMATWQAIVSWKFAVGSGNMALEPVFRVTWADGNTDLDQNEVWGFTPGVQIFFYKRNKLALNWDFANPTSDALRGENSFKARVQFHF